METIPAAFWKKAGSAIVMGTAIYGMHYTGLAAAVFAPNSICAVSPQNIHQVGLAVTLGGFTLLFLMATLLVSAFDAYLAGRSSKHAETLRALNTRLEGEARVRAHVEEALRQAQAGLEARVAERTAALEESEARLRANTAKLQALSRRLVDAEEAYRRQLARELHDRVGQNLTALNINLEMALNGVSPELGQTLAPRLTDSIALVNATAETIGDVLSELRPPILDEYGLLAALRSLARQFTQRTGIRVAVKGEASSERLNSMAEIVLYRIAQEALNNVAKHAHATQVEIALASEPHRVSLTIADNGSGFIPGTTLDAKSGWGMITMRERAEAVGGALTVDSAPGKGTHVRVTLAG